MKRFVTLSALCLVAALVAMPIAAFAQPAPVASTKVTGVSGSSGPGMIIAAPAGCGSGALCFWRGNNTPGGTQGPGQLAGRESKLAVVSHPSCQTGTWNNCASYAFNNGNNCTAVMWDGTGYTFGAAGAVWIDRGFGVDLTTLGFNDKASSNSWISPQHTTTSTCPGPNPF